MGARRPRTRGPAATTPRPRCWVCRNSNSYASIDASNSGDDCPETCLTTGYSCDYLIAGTGLTCENLETTYWRDCGGCVCGNAYSRGSYTLKSPELSGGSGGVLIEFWYHMYGFGMGTLALGTFDGTTWTTQWSETHDQRNEWIFASVTVDTEVVRARLIGTTGGIMYSDMALDDIVIWGGAPSAAPTGLTPVLSASPVPTPNPATSSEPTSSPTVMLPVFCDFDDGGWCGWSPDAGGGEWLLGSASADDNTGPSSDHTSGSGYYAWVDARDSQAAYNYGRGPFWLESYDLVGGSSGVLIEFWYHVYGETMGTLELETFDGAVWTT